MLLPREGPRGRILFACGATRMAANGTRMGREFSFALPAVMPLGHHPLAGAKKEIRGTSAAIRVGSQTGWRRAMEWGENFLAKILSERNYKKLPEIRGQKWSMRIGPLLEPNF